MEVATLEEFKALKEEVSELKKEIAILKAAKPIEWLTVKQAAEKLNCHEDTVYTMAREGKLTRKKGKKKVEISYESVLDYNRKHTIEKTK